MTRIRNRRRCCSAPGSATIVPLARLFPAHRSALPMLASILPFLAVRLQWKRLAWVDTLRSSPVTLVYSTGTIGVSAKLWQKGAHEFHFGGEINHLGTPEAN